VPIKPENRKLYPPNWEDIRKRILKRAGNKCEGSPAFPDCRVGNGKKNPHTGNPRVRLTIAHYPDHNPQNNQEDNLHAWCERCHNTMDAPHRRKNALKTREKRRHQMEMIKVTESLCDIQKQLDYIDAHPTEENIKGLDIINRRLLHFEKMSLTKKREALDRLNEMMPPG